MHLVPRGRSLIPHVLLGAAFGHLAARAAIGGRAWWVARRRLRLASVTVADSRLAYRVGHPARGSLSAAPFVCVPGLAVSSRYFVPLMAALSRTHAVWCVHPPGHTGSAAGSWPVTIDGYAKAVLAMLDRLHVRAPVLIANSMGCQMALHLAAHHPERVRALVLIGPTADVRARSWVAQGVRLLRSIPHDQRAIDLTVASDYLHTGFVRGVRELRAMLHDVPEDTAARVHCPVLLLRGRRDHVAPRRWLQMLAGRLPRAAVQEIGGAGHAVHFTQAARVAALCRRFAASLPAR